MKFRMPAISGGTGFSNLESFRTGSFRVTLTKHTFFDRAAVKDALRYMNFYGLSRASLAVRRNAMKSIKQKGHARPPSKIENLNRGMTLGELIEKPGLPARTKGMLIRKLQEIKFPKPSPAGTPPFTHVEFGHMLGFRRNVYNAWDPGTQSAIAGPMQRGDSPFLPALHEFGRSKTLRAYLYLGRTPSHRPLIRWQEEGQAPKSPLWQRMKRRKRVKYPKRAFMRPAMEKAVKTGQIAKAFRGTFGPFRGRGGDYAG
jgi:hypothetical protein